MKSLPVFFINAFLIFMVKTSLAQYPAQNISLYANWHDSSVPAEPHYGIKYQGVWGYADTANGKEYAIIGSSAGTYFIEVTNPLAPVVRDYVPGRRDSCIWREYKTFGKYVYMISDDPAPNSLQIADLSYLPDSVHVVYDDTTLFVHAHTLFVDNDKIYFGSVTQNNNFYAMAVYSLANPELPSLIKGLNESFLYSVHDMYVRNDTVYASWGYDGFYIYKFNSDSTFTTLGSLTSYPDQGYNHSSSLTPDGKTLVFCDEVPEGLAVKILDVSDFSDLTIKSTFKSNPGATAHNPYVVGNNKLVIAYYQDGIQIYDISNPSNPVRTGFFDTDTLNGLNNGYPDNPTYQGCWGAYTELPSGILLASDMQNGLFVLNSTLALGISDKGKTIAADLIVYPNPSGSDFTLRFNLKKEQKVNYQITDLTGRTIANCEKNAPSGISDILLEELKLSKGIYLLKFNSKEFCSTRKLIKTE